jgi:hypothetical protein
MKIMTIVLFLATLTACTAIQTQTGGRAVVPGSPYEEVFSAAVQAAMDAGLTVTKAEKDNGLIVATASHNPFLTYNPPIINIFVRKVNDTISISLKSIVHGQLVDYGTSENNISAFCSSFLALYPNATCQVIEK